MSSFCQGQEIPGKVNVAKYVLSKAGYYPADRGKTPSDCCVLLPSQSSLHSIAHPLSNSTYKIFEFWEYSILDTVEHGRSRMKLFRSGGPLLENL